jgi:hypothetical protein
MQGGSGLVWLPLVGQGNAEIVVGFGGIGLERERATVNGNGLVQLPLVPQRGAEITVGFGPVGFEGDGPPDQIRGDVMPPDLMGDDAEKVQRLSMIRLLGENLTV